MYRCTMQLCFGSGDKSLNVTFVGNGYTFILINRKRVRNSDSLILNIYSATPTYVHESYLVLMMRVCREILHNIPDFTYSFLAQVINVARQISVKNIG